MRKDRTPAAAKPDYLFLGLLAALLAVGFIVLTSASGPVAVERYGNVFHLVKRQALYGLLPGAFLFVLAAGIDIRQLRNAYAWFYGSSILLLALVFIPGVAADWGTSHSWLSVAGLSIQPVEIVKLTFIFAAAGWLVRMGERELNDWRTGLLPFLFGFGALGGLLIMQPDTGGLMVLGFIAVAMYVVAGAPWRDFAAIAGLGALGLAAIVKTAPYRAERFMTFLHPEKDPLGIGYHINQAYLAIGSGGWFGLGLGHSRQKFQYLPEVAGDSIVAVMAEELGFVAVVAFLAAYLAFCWRGFGIARRSPDDFSRYVAVGIMAWISAQAFLNVGSMLGLMPMTGLPLPFVSHGGSALMMTLLAMGVMVGISRRAKGQ
jgi:cell division protein FtsW